MNQRRTVRAALLASAGFLSCVAGVGFAQTPAPSPAPTATPATPAAQTGDVLDAAPADASMVLVITKLSDLSRKITLTNESLGLGIEQLDDPMLRFRQALGIIKGLDEEGAMLVVLTTAQNGKPGGTLVLVPVNDYAGFIASFKGDGGKPVTPIVIGDGSTGFAKKVGGFAVMGPDQAVVEAYRPAGKGADLAATAGKRGAPTIASSAVSLYINPADNGPAIQAWVKSMIALAKSMQPTVANKPDAIKAIENMIDSSIDAGLAAMLRDATGVILGIDIDNRNAYLTLAAQFKPGSPSAAIFPGGGEAVEQMNRLPNETYIFTAATTPGFALGKLLENLAAVIPAENPVLAPDTVRKTAAILAKSKSVAQAYYPSRDNNVGGNLIPSIITAETSDPRGIAEATKDLVTSLGGGEGAPPPKPGEMKIAVAGEYLPAAMQLEGVAADQFTIKYSVPAQLMNALGPSASSIYIAVGSGVFSGYVAQVEKQVVFTTSAKETHLLVGGINASKQTSGLGSNPTIAKSRADLTPKPTAEAYLNFVGIFAAVNSYHTILGEPIIPVPNDLNPVAAGITANAGSAQARVVVPISVIKFVKTLLNPPPPPVGPDGKPAAAKPE